jgi:23S rRNA pseudouridine2457 synthase
MYRYILLNKPYNVICQFSPNGNDNPTLKDYVPILGVYPVGRLDQDSEGLVLLTDNGLLQHRLSDPQYAHPKTYWVQVEGIPDEDSLEPLRRGGIALQGYRTRPAKVEILAQEPELPPRNPPIRYRKRVPTSWLEITLTEGKNRQIRRMSAKVGFPTLRLVRVSLSLTKSGNFSLSIEGLEPGQWRELTQAEKALFERNI